MRELGEGRGVRGGSRCLPRPSPLYGVPRYHSVMKALFLLGVALSLVACGSKSPPMPKPALAKEITFPAKDGKKVFADLYRAGATQSTAVILMFHQAHSSAAEYYPIAPRVSKLGFDCLAVDQRSGGDMYGPNRTAAQYSGDPGYMAAYNDVEGALDWAQKQGYTTIVAWGSSYSSCLVLRLGSDHPDALKAVIGYSPGEYFDDKGIVAQWAAGVKVPVYAVNTVDERADADGILKGHIGERMASVAVIHGSSTLRSDKNPKGAEKCWKDLEPFLKSYAPAAGK